MAVVPPSALPYKERYKRYVKWQKAQWAHLHPKPMVMDYVRWKKYSRQSTLPDDCKAGIPEDDTIRRPSDRHKIY